MLKSAKKVAKKGLVGVKKKGKAEGSTIGNTGPSTNDLNYNSHSTNLRPSDTTIGTGISIGNSMGMGMNNNRRASTGEVGKIMTSASIFGEDDADESGGGGNTNPFSSPLKSPRRSFVAPSSSMHLNSSSNSNSKFSLNSNPNSNSNLMGGGNVGGGGGGTSNLASSPGISSIDGKQSHVPPMPPPYDESTNTPVTNTGIAKNTSSATSAFTTAAPSSTAAPSASSSSAAAPARPPMRSLLKQDGFVIDKKGRTRIVMSDNNNNNSNNNNDELDMAIMAIKVKKFRIANPYDPTAVGDLVCRITPSVRVDPRSIGGNLLSPQRGLVSTSSRNVVFDSSPPVPDQDKTSAVTSRLSKSRMGIRTNECLLSLRVNRFELYSTSIASYTSAESAYGNFLDTAANAANNQDYANSTSLPTLSYGQIKKNIRQKGKNKLRYICLVRSTNRPLQNIHRKTKNQVYIKGDTVPGLDENSDDNSNTSDDDYHDVHHAMDHHAADDGTMGRHSHADGHDDDNHLDGYDTFYNPDPEDDGILGVTDNNNNNNNNNNHAKPSSSSKKSLSASGGGTAKSHKEDDLDNGVLPRDEISSFPSLVCLALYNDGTHPDVRKVLTLDKLIAVESLNTSNSNNANSNSSGSVKLVFATGDVVEIDCDATPPPPTSQHNHNATAAANPQEDDLKSANMKKKERFLWSLLQFHAILCTSVVERNLTSRTGGMGAGYVGVTPSLTSAPSSSKLGLLPQLVMRNVDRAELQYLSTVNGFLSDSPILCALLDRQRNWDVHGTTPTSTSATQALEAGDGGAGGETKDASPEENEDEHGNRRSGRSGDGTKSVDEMDGIAYDMMMGNYNKLTLFVNEEEKKDAEEVLNSMSWQVGSGTNGSSGTVGDGSAMANNPAASPAAATTSTGTDTNATDAIGTTADALSQLLQKRMHDLEAETCRRLIAWEDEKYYSLTGTAPKRRDTMEALSLSNLFETLDKLDKELVSMEGWLIDKGAAIKPLTDDCRDIEEENRQLEQQRKSFDMLGTELRRLLDGLDVPAHVEEILAKPSKLIQYHNNGSVNVNESKDGVEPIYQAGRMLKSAFDKVEKEGGVHLRAVNERLEALASLATVFCTSLAEIVVSVMEQLAAQVVNDSDFKSEAKGSTHSVVAKKIRDTQRGFQSSLLDYINLIEVLALLKPAILPAIRDAYSELVAEGVLSKKRMKLYFASLPGKSTVVMSNVTSDLKEYTAVTLRSSTASEPGSANMKPVHAKDIEAALAEILPVIAREAYFTAALFGLSSKHLDGREKKKNFESAKKSVDNSSQYFKYYMSRICGIASEADAEGKKVHGDPMLSLVASIHLNETMDGYIDRQKKGGDHSLSLAYVRATILDLRKKVDKQWVTWVEEQIKWIRTNPGVPPNGKRAGVFLSFARFPSYLDHVMICCKAGRPKDYIPNLSKIKVITYYLQKMAGALFASLHECAERESTDQQYAANVMRMENSYFFTQSIKQRGPELTELFKKQITAASTICKQSTDAYLGWMIKREFKPLHTLFSNISRIRRDVGDADVPIHVPRATFERTLSKESNREVMKEKIGVIYGRMEKHLSEAGGLLPVAWKALVKVLYEWFGRWEKLSTQCYKFILEPSAVDVVRIAKAAGGVASSRRNLTDDKLSKDASVGSSRHTSRKVTADEKNLSKRNINEGKTYEKDLSVASSRHSTSKSYKSNVPMSGAASKTLEGQF